MQIRFVSKECGIRLYEGVDFNSLKNERVQIEGTRQVKREVADHMRILSKAKEICMIQHRNIGHQIRRYLIEVENALQIPQVIAHSLMAAILDSHLWF